MNARHLVLVAIAAISLSACSVSVRRSSSEDSMGAVAVPPGRLAQIYYWRARPGVFDEYTRYIREVAEPIDEEARRRGAFVSVTTYMTRDTASAWTHMRVFILRDSAQLRALSAQLDSAGRRLEPDSAKRRVRGEYSATLRDRVGAVVGEIVR